MQKILNKIIWKNRFANIYFMWALNSKFIRGIILEYVSKMHYKYRLDFFYHVRKYINQYEGELRPGIVEFRFAGNRIKVPFTDKAYGGTFAILCHDIEVKETYVDLLDKFSCRLFYDIGANSGYHSLIVSSFGIKVVSFEPNEYCYIRYKSLFAENDFCTEWVQRAVGSQNGKMLLNYKEDETYLGFISDKKVGGYRSNEIDVVSLDSFTTKRQLPDLIKIDTEGSELKVLEGAILLIKSSSPFIILEFDYNLSDLSAIVNFLDDIEYKIVTIPLGKQSKYVTKENISTIVTDSANVLAFHQSFTLEIEEIISCKDL